MDARTSDSRVLYVTLACLLGAIYSSYLLYQDIQNRGARSGAPAARLERTQKKVRLKPAQSFVWGNVKANEDLYLKDSIQTAPQGAATIRFTDGSTLDLGENSLIIIDTAQNLSLNFLRGSAVLRSQAGDSKITVDNQGKTTVEKLPIRLLSPEALSEFYVSQGGAKTVSFEWDAQPKPGEELPDAIEFANNRDFRGSRVRSYKIDAAAKHAEFSLPEGQYFWRLTSRSKPSTESDEFKITAVSPLRPLFPIASEKIPSFDGEGSVQFRWVAAQESPAAPESAESEDPEDSSKIVHKLEISSDPQFRSVLASRDISAASGVSILKSLPDGTHYWRISSQYPGLTLRSPAEKFQVERVGKVAIELSEPDEGSSVDMHHPIRFSWSAAASNVEYRWQIRGANTESADVKRGKIYAWNASRPGEYEWNVQAIYNGDVVGESAWRKVSASEGAPIALEEPKFRQQIRYWSDPARFTFKWKNEGGVASYRVQVASNADFQNAVSTESPAPEVSSSVIRLTPGTQFWRVEGLDAAKHVVRTSEIGTFDFEPYPLLRAPASAKPDPGSVINPLEIERDPVISWSPVENARSYDLIVKQGEKLVLQQNVKVTQVALKNLAAGKYQYTVRAIDEGQRKGEALASREFEINFGNPLSAPEATSPEVQ